MAARLPDRAPHSGVLGPGRRRAHLTNLRRRLRRDTGRPARGARESLATPALTGQGARSPRWPPRESRMPATVRRLAWRVARPIRKSEPTATCVVETGRPKRLAASTRQAVERLEKSASMGSRRGDPVAHGLRDPPRGGCRPVPWPPPAAPLPTTARRARRSGIVREARDRVATPAESGGRHRRPRSRARRRASAAGAPRRGLPPCRGRG